ncbi:MAG: CoA transferase, partial [Actinobacteria bacterium]|nr:CoA transferase [Actinomycetota bacterium]
VSTSLLRQGLYTIGFDVNTTLRFGVSIGVATRETMGNPVINSYRDRDGRWFWLIGLEGERHWPDLCRAVGRTEWLDDDRFASPRGRRKNARELCALLDEVFATRTRDEWGGVFDRENVWWAPVQDIDQVVEDPQVRASGGFVDVPDGGGTATMVATPVDFSATPWAPRSMPPAIGEHTDEILGEIGVPTHEVAALRERGVVA